MKWTRSDHTQLESLVAQEDLIEAGATQVGEALNHIRDLRLWMHGPVKYSSFADYVTRRWRMSPSWAYLQISQQEAVPQLPMPGLVDMPTDAVLGDLEPPELPLPDEVAIPSDNENDEPPPEDENEVYQDLRGTVLKNDRLIMIFSTIEDWQLVIREISRVENRIEAIARGPAGHYLRKESILTDLRNVQVGLRHAMPYAQAPKELMANPRVAAAGYVTEGQWKRWETQREIKK